MGIGCLGLDGLGLGSLGLGSLGLGCLGYLGLGYLSMGYTWAWVTWAWVTWAWAAWALGYLGFFCLGLGQPGPLLYVHQKLGNLVYECPPKQVDLIDKHDLKGLNKKPRENATSTLELDSIVLYEILKIVKQIQHEIFRKRQE